MFNILGKCSPAQHLEQSLINQYPLIDLFAVFSIQASRIKGSNLTMTPIF